MRKWRHPYLSMLALVAMIAAALPVSACVCPTAAGAPTVLPCTMSASDSAGQDAMPCCAKTAKNNCCNPKQPAPTRNDNKVATLAAAPRDSILTRLSQAAHGTYDVTILPIAPDAVEPASGLASRLNANATHLASRHAPPFEAGRAPPQ